jgi:hypothetical protein
MKTIHEWPLMNPHHALESWQLDNDRAIAEAVRKQADPSSLAYVRRIRALNEPAREELIWKLLGAALALPNGAEIVERKLLEVELLNVQMTRKGASK